MSLVFQVILFIVHIQKDFFGIFVLVEINYKVFVLLKTQNLQTNLNKLENTSYVFRSRTC